MRKILLMSLALALALTVSFAYAAEKPGTAKEAMALVDKAIAYYKANGQDKAFAAFDDTKGQFVDRDLYIFVMDWNGTILAHGANKALINKPTWDLKDPDGKLFMREMVNVAKTKGKGWVDYKWTSPVTKKIGQKSSYVVRVGDLLIGCGIYK